MAEKRKPSYTMLLRKQGKKKAQKIEIFPRELFEPDTERNNYRLRVNGKWWNPPNHPEYLTKTQIKELVFRSINLK